VLVTAVDVIEVAGAVTARFDDERREAVDTAAWATTVVWAPTAVRAARWIASPIARNANALSAAVTIRAREATCRRRFRSSLIVRLEQFESPA
jgi:hypothetical protein